MERLSQARALRDSLRARDPVVGGWVSIGHPAVAEITARAGLDFVTVDTEHAPIDVADLESLVRAVDAADGDAVPFVRTPSSDPVALKRALDTGVGGVMVPRVEDAAEAERVVDATTYPPEGIRGTAGGRAADYGATLPAYLAEADDAVTRVVQVETTGAVERAEAIGAVDGVDALFVGPADLSAALDVPLEVRGAVDDVLDAAHAVDVPVGVFATDADQLADWLADGFDFAIVGYDAAILRAGTRDLVAAFDDAVDR
jgi:2-keto-3-deoxy-L-rhamnonate aldolase RhmA